MIDPITATKTVHELAGIAKGLYDYINDVKTAPKRARELREMLSHVLLLLNPLREVLTAKSTIEVPLESAIMEFEKILKDMQAEVDESKVKGIKRVTWPFNKDVKNRLSSMIEKYKGTFQMALSLKTS